MSPSRRVGGVISAVLFYRNEEGGPLWDAFENNLALLKSCGVDGLCVNGATGEYASASREERRQAVSLARRAMGSHGIVVSGAGAASWLETLQLARDAESEGADAHLVPAPHFFPYQQSDLAEFYCRTAAALTRPVIIYNLPQFTGKVERELALTLIRDQSINVAGIKDSSGNLDILEALTVEGPADAVRLVGNDGVLAKALQQCLCGGMISGVAGVLPELNQGLWEASRRGDSQLFESAALLLAQFIERLNPWPTPWGLKLAAQVRGIGPASIALPLSPERATQASEFRNWFEPWWAAAREALSTVKDEA
jgi:4-hydroxy-tetrahydrodipicolinate synthase